MRRSFAVAAASLLTAACGGGQSATPGATAPAPAPAAPQAAAPAGDPAVLRYGASTNRYRLEQATAIHQEVMGQATDIDGTISLLLTAALSSAPDGSGISAVYTLDSVAATGAGAGPAGGGLATARGKTWRASLSNAGRGLGLTPPDTAAATAQASEVFRDFLPTLPPSAVAGTSWVDTVRSAPTGQGMQIRTTSIRTSQVVGWETHDGVRALKVQTNGTYTLSGGGNQGGQEMQLTGTGVATTERFISAAGVYLGATSRDSANIMVNVVSAGIEVPVRQVRRTTVTRLP